jgi:hypothetical protein
MSNFADIFYKVDNKKDLSEANTDIVVDSFLLDNSLTLTDTNSISNNLMKIHGLISDPKYVSQQQKIIQKGGNNKKPEIFSESSIGASYSATTQTAHIPQDTYSESSISCAYREKDTESSITNDSFESTSALEKYIALVEAEFKKEKNNSS